MSYPEKAKSRVHHPYIGKPSKHHNLIKEYICSVIAAV
jgi:hypothetical protein